MKIKHIFFPPFLVVVLLSVLVSCQKQDPVYVDDARVNFWVLQDTFYNTGSKVYETGYTFASQPDDTMSDTIYIRVKTMGPIVSYGRNFKAISDTANTTAVEGTDYKILDGYVAADTFAGHLPVVLYKTPALKTTTKSLGLVLSANGIFSPGVQEDRKYLVFFNDGLVRPDNWTLLTTYFGDYSEVKYKFIISTLGISQFPVSTGAYRLGQFTHYQMLDFKNQVKDALAVYNSTHPEPMKDELNALITFP